MILPHNLQFALITNPVTIYYYTGLFPSPTEREAFLFVTPKQTFLYHSPFIQPPHTVTSLPMSIDNTFPKTITLNFPANSNIAIEAENLTVAEQTRIQSIVPLSFQPIDDWLKNSRIIKNQNELKFIKKACQISQSTIRWLDQFLPSAADITEIQLQRLIDNKMYDLGATNTAFPTIVAFDHHSSLPHHTPSTRKLKSNSVVLIDFGAEYQHYKSDYTRTWCLGTPSPLFSKIKHAVDLAYKESSKLISTKVIHDEDQIKNSPPSFTKEGARGCLLAKDLDDTARKIITDAGFGDKFIHTTGHGLGLEAHEPPSLNPNNHQELSTNMVITIEPGIYIPQKFGYRYENTIIL